MLAGSLCWLEHEIKFSLKFTFVGYIFYILAYMKLSNTLLQRHCRHYDKIVRFEEEVPAHSRKLASQSNWV